MTGHTMVYNIKVQHKKAKYRANMVDEQHSQGTDDVSVHVQPVARSLFPVVMESEGYIADLY